MSSKKYSAFDYTSQKWVTGAAAKDLIIQQQTERLLLLASDKGEEYCKASGKDISQEVSNTLFAFIDLGETARLTKLLKTPGNHKFTVLELLDALLSKAESAC